MKIFNSFNLFLFLIILFVMSMFSIPAWAVTSEGVILKCPMNIDATGTELLKNDIAIVSANSGNTLNYYISLVNSKENDYTELLPYNTGRLKYHEGKNLDSLGF